MDKFAVIGDVHGCLRELEQLLALIPSGHRICFVGDLVDRGPDSAGVVRLVRKFAADGAVMVRGNHDDWYVRRAKGNTRPNPKKEVVFMTLTAEDIAFLDAAPTAHELRPGLLVVHAGLETCKPAYASTDHVRMRYLDEDGRMLRIGAAGAPPPGSRYWAEAWEGPEVVVFGHHTFDEVTTFPWAIAVDTGCGYGMKLSAAIFEGTTLVGTISVPNDVAYAEYHGVVEDSGK